MPLIVATDKDGETQCPPETGRAGLGLGNPVICRHRLGKSALKRFPSFPAPSVRSSLSPASNTTPFSEKQQTRRLVCYHCRMVTLSVQGREGERTPILRRTPLSRMHRVGLPLLIPQFQPRKSGSGRSLQNLGWRNAGCPICPPPPFLSLQL